jgi:uncharacterized membrane-anchored protein
VVRNKAPEAAVAFWVVTLLAITAGETAAEWLTDEARLGLGGTTSVASGLLALALAAQIRTRRHVPGVYWLAVVLISIVGLLITDELTDVVGVALAASAVLFAAALVATFAIWHRVEGTVSIDHVDTPRREAFSWTAILFTFALGSAAGDWLADGLALGYLASLVVFAAALGVVAIAHFRLGLGPVVAFWMAYVLTWPLGASIGDFLSQPAADGGLGLGTAVTSASDLAAIVLIVAHLSVQERHRTGLRAAVNEVGGL